MLKMQQIIIFLCDKPVIDIYKLIITLYIPILLVGLNYYIGMKLFAKITNYEINLFIKKVTLIVIVRLIFLLILSLIFYKTGVVYPKLYFILLFLLVFIFKLKEILRINAIKR